MLAISDLTDAVGGGSEDDVVAHWLSTTEATNPVSTANGAAIATAGPRRDCDPATEALAGFG
ncbi:MAG TPA: hypothetical protein VIX63_03375 [Vicinamibacterales bacterium]